MALETISCTTKFLHVVEFCSAFRKDNYDKICKLQGPMLLEYISLVPVLSMGSMVAGVQLAEHLKKNSHNQ